MLFRSEISLIWRPVGKIKDALPKFKDIPKNKSCIYGITCNKCSEQYIGETMKGKECRLKQHRYALERKDFKSSALAEHWRDSGHKDFDFENATIIEVEPTTSIRKTKEAYYIRKFKAGLNRIEEKGAFDPSLFLLNSWPL